MINVITMTDEKISKNKSNRHLTDRMIRRLFFICGISATIAVFFIIFFLFQRGYPALESVGITEFLTGDNWNPTGSGGFESYGTLALIAGTLIITAGAIAIAVPLGIGSAIFISEIAPRKLGSWMKSLIEILAGIPSIVFGLFGMLILVPWIMDFFNVPTGSGWFAGSIILGIMALPTIVSVSEDAISSVPRDIKEASLGLGATKWQTIRRIIVPSSLSGITAAVILGMGRAIGETMAVMMVTGNVPLIPTSVLGIHSTIMPLTGAIGIEMGEAAGIHQSALFVLGLILFAIILLMNSSANYILKQVKKKFTASKDENQKFQLRNLIPAIIMKKKQAIIHVVKIVSILGLILLSFFVISELFGYIITGTIFLIITIIWIANTRLNSRKQQKLAYFIITLSVFAVIAVLGIILYYIVVNGAQALSWEFLTAPPSRLGREGGIFPAIMGSMWLVSGALLIAVPVGIGAGIYLAEYAKESRATKIIRSGIDTLNGTPSIVFGLFAYAFLVVYLGLGISLQTGMIILGLLVLPLIIRTTEEAIKSVPQNIREGSLALGSTKWETIKKVVLPPARPGIITGVIIAIGRAIGESAPILFTATTFMSLRNPSDLSSPVMSLPTHIFYLTKEVHGPEAKMNAYGTALVLLIIIIVIYGTAGLIRSYYKKKLRW
jgi:phosphate transport system permease protein